MSQRRYRVSRNRLGGSVSDTCLDKLLASCAAQLITGIITIESPLARGRIELRAGGVSDADYMGLQDEAAVAQMRALASGSYELVQCLPTLDGGLGSVAACHGDLANSSVIEIMRLCEDQALSCTVTVARDRDRAEICYQAGDIKDVLFNGASDDDKLVEVVKWREGTFRVTVPPLALHIDGWPSTALESPAKQPAKQLLERPCSVPSRLRAEPRVNPRRSAPAAKQRRHQRPSRTRRPPLAEHQSATTRARVDKSGRSRRLDTSAHRTLRAATLVGTPDSPNAALLIAAAIMAAAMLGVWLLASAMLNTL